MRRNVVWLAAAAIIVIVFGTIYGAVQHEQRAAADDPQIQLAEDAAAKLDRGEQPFNLITGHIDMASSLLPYTIVYDKTGKAVAGSGYLDGQLGQPPVGILKAANNNPYHTVSWQPRSGVRVAAVTVAAKGYYVLAGRSLTEIEKNESQTFLIASLGAALSLVVLGGVWTLSQTATPTKKSR